MDYKIEILVNKKIIFSKIYKGYSHPNQVIKLAVKGLKKQYDYMSVFVMNRYGEVWNYVIEKKRAWPVFHDFRNKNEVGLVFSGNLDIYELVGGKQ